MNIIQLENPLFINTRIAGEILVQVQHIPIVPLKLSLNLLQQATFLNPIAIMEIYTDPGIKILP